MPMVDKIADDKGDSKEKIPFEFKKDEFEDFTINISQLLLRRLQFEFTKFKNKVIEVKKSEHKNKDKLIPIYYESIDLYKEIYHKTEQVYKLQKELIDLSNKRETLKEEIEKLLLN